MSFFTEPPDWKEGRWDKAVKAHTRRPTFELILRIIIAVEILIILFHLVKGVV